MNIICIMAKSCTGKSTVINEIFNRFKKETYIVKSYSTRLIRENDPNDINTHIFVDDLFFNKHKDKVFSIYKDKINNYKNWTDETSFKKEKCNLYAIDPKAFKEMVINNKDINTIGIYLDINESERLLRHKLRGDEINFSAEDHLSFYHINDMKNVFKINVDKKTPSEVADEIISIAKKYNFL